MALWTPANTSTSLWLDPSDTSKLFDATSGGSLPSVGSAVLRIEDKSGGAVHFTEATNAPTRQSGPDSQSVLRFDGINDWLSATLSLSQPYTVFLAFKLNGSPTSEADVFSSNSPLVVLRPNWSGSGNRLQYAGGSSLTGAALTSGSEYVWGTVFNGSSSYNSLNGTVSSTAAAGSGALGTLRLGRQGNGSAYLNCDIYEVVVKSGAVSTDDREKLEGYMAHKWNLESLLPGGHTYKSSAPTTGGSPVPIFRNHYQQQGIC